MRILFILGVVGLGGSTSFMDFYAPVMENHVGSRLFGLTRELLRNEFRLAQEGFVPISNSDREVMRIGDGGSTEQLLSVGTSISRKRYSTIMTVRDDPGLVIKYQANCENLGLVHTLARDYFFLKYLQPSGLVPAVHYLSPPIRFSRELMSQHGKFSFAAAGEMMEKCLAHKWSSVRFMVMERAHDAVAPIAMSRPFTLAQAVDLSLNLVRFCRYLHENKMIHGDIHAGNVVLLRREGRLRFGLIDFGNAMFEDEFRKLPELEGEPMSYVHCYHSHWNILGFRSSYRDDVFKAILTGAMAAGGAAFYSACDALVKDPETMFDYKSELSLFEFPGMEQSVFDVPIPGKNEAEIAAVRGLIDRASTLARSVEGIDDAPPYDDIISALREARTILAPPAV